MTQDLLDIENDIDLEKSDIGKMYLYWARNYPDGHVFGFSSTLENIGVLDKHDCTLENKTQVLLLGDPVEANHFTNGPITVSRIMAHKCMWVPTCFLVPIDVQP